MTFIPGRTLMELFENWSRGNDNHHVNTLLAIRFCKELLETVKRIHEKGVIHRDVKPANIIIKCDNLEEHELCSTCQPVLIDYEIAYIQKTDDSPFKNDQTSNIGDITITHLTEDLGHQWCRVAQLAKSSDSAVRQMTKLQKYERVLLRRSPTVDASSVCAILFTLLTKEHPGSTRSEKGAQPHHRHAKKLQMALKNTIPSEGMKIGIKMFILREIPYRVNLAGDGCTTAF